MAAPDPKLTWRRVAIFLALVAALSAIFDAAIIGIGTLGAGFGMYTMALMWMPALAAVLTCWITGLPLGQLGWRWPPWRDVGIAWFLPLGYGLITYAVIWISGGGGVPDGERVAALAKAFGVPGWSTGAVIALHVAFLASMGILRGLSNAIGEEIGWRGFLAPQLAQVTSFGGNVMIAGTAWLLYHVPVLVFADYNAGTPWWYGLPCFAVMVYGMTAFMTSVRLRTNSVWPAAIIHSSHNVFIQTLFTPLTIDTGPTEWLIDEFGIGLAIAIGGLGVWTWIRETGARRAPHRFAEATHDPVNVVARSL